MRVNALEGQVRHVGRALRDAWWKLRLRQLLERFTGEFLFRVIVFVLRYVLELETCRVQLWAAADGAVPSVVVPGDADGDVAQGCRGRHKMGLEKVIIFWRESGGVASGMPRCYSDAVIDRVYGNLDRNA